MISFHAGDFLTTRPRDPLMLNVPVPNERVVPGMLHSIG